MDIAEIRNIVQLCRELGVAKIKTADIELELGPPSPAAVEHPAAIDPEPTDFLFMGQTPVLTPEEEAWLAASGLRAEVQKEG